MFLFCCLSGVFQRSPKAALNRSLILVRVSHTENSIDQFNNQLQIIPSWSGVSQCPLTVSPPHLLPLDHFLSIIFTKSRLLLLAIFRAGHSRFLYHKNNVSKRKYRKCPALSGGVPSSPLSGSTTPRLLPS